MTLPNVINVLIIGGGPAGQAAAVSVARNVHTAIVFDSHEYHPEAFREAARKNTTEHYRFISFVDTKIMTAKKSDGFFVVADNTGASWTGRGLVLVSGVADVMLNTPGYAECWGRSILFCFGYEQRGSPLFGILATNSNLHVSLYMHVARSALQLFSAVIIYTNGDTSRTMAFREAVGSKAAITINERRITYFTLGENGIGVTITFEDGMSKHEAFLAHNPDVKLRSAQLVEQLGLEVTRQSGIMAQPPFGETSVSGCFAAGDAMLTTRMVPNAFSTGAMAASGVAGHV